MSSSSVGVVTIAHGRHHHLAAQHESLARGSRVPDRYVVVAMDDPDLVATTSHGLLREVCRTEPSPDGLPLSAARNLGAAHLTGLDVLVFLDVDCLTGPELVSEYQATARRHPDHVWSGPLTYLPPSPDGYDVHHLEALDDPHPARPAPSPGVLETSADPDLFWSLSFALTGDAWRRTGGF
jgi:hypothetical protein